MGAFSDSLFAVGLRLRIQDAEEGGQHQALAPSHPRRCIGCGSRLLAYMLTPVKTVGVEIPVKCPSERTTVGAAETLKRRCSFWITCKLISVIVPAELLCN